MKNRLVFILIAIVFNSCLGYDRLIIYHKDYVPEISPALRFDGYYRDVEPDNDSNNYFKARCPDGLTPIFFYTDGSVFNNLKFCNQDSLRSFIYNHRTSPYLWAVFNCKADSITIEAFYPNTGTFNYDRYHLKGVIKNDSIFFTQLIDRKINTKNISETYVFVPYDIKPDSSQNFIMNENRFNK